MSNLGEDDIALLQHLDTAHLQRLLDEGNELDTMVMESSYIKSLENDKQMINIRISSIAEFNLSQETKFNNTKQRLAESYNEVRTLRDDYVKNDSLMDANSNDLSLDTIRAIMQTDCAKIEEESETLADRFVNGEFVLDNFMDLFIDKKTLTHLRKIRTEKMAELMNSRPAVSRPAPAPVSNQPMPPSQNSHWGMPAPPPTGMGNLPPYQAGPMGGPQMAMPNPYYQRR